MSNAQGQALQNTTLYGYGQAMYHAFGRGFQGFRSIQEWDLTQGSALETVFHQRFPLTSRVERQTVRVLHVDGAEAAPGLPLSITRNDWRCGLSNRAACPTSGAGWSGGFPFLDRTEVETFDAASAESGATQTAIARKTVSYTPWPELSATACPALPTGGSSGYDTYGNLRHKVELVEDLGTDARLSKACSLEQHDYQPADISAAVWWVNRLQQTTQHRRVEYSSLHALPSGVTAADLNPGQSRRSKFVWDAATRLLSTQQEELLNSTDGVAEVLTASTFFYPPTTPSNCAGATSATGVNGINYGLPTCVRVSRGAVTAGQGAASSIPLATASPATRDTRTAYSTDGYFPSQVRNALGHTVSTVVRPRDGQPSTVTDANGLQTTMQYDAFGFLQRTRYPQRDNASLGRQPDAVTGLEACGAPGITCTGIPGAQYRQQTAALGAPTRMQYFDVLGREIASEVEVRAAQGSIGGARISRSGVFHNQRGLVTREAAPVAVTAFGASVAGWPTAYTEYSDFDVLGRAGHKREVGFGRLSVQSNDNTPGGAVAAPSRLTDYTYTGRTTAILAYDSTGNESAKRRLSRTVDGLGRHLHTQDADPAASTATGASTQFWFDAWGQPTVIRDAKGVLTRAVHDAAGRRHLTIDPNQGTSTYLYSGFGELLRQVDARGVALEYGYDALGRQTRRQTVAPLNPDAQQSCAAPDYAEFSRVCDARLIDRFFFDGAIDVAGTLGDNLYAKGLPSGHQREVLPKTGAGHIERRVWDSFDGNGRITARHTEQSLAKQLNGSSATAGTRRYTHRWRYDSRFGRLLGEAWPNGVGRGFVYSSIGSVELETGLSSAAEYGLDRGVPPVLRSVQLVNALGAPTRELLGDTTGTHLVVERNQNVQTGETESVLYTRGAEAIWSETYRYDAFGNLQRRAQQQDGGYTQVEHFSYDRLHRMTESRLITGASAAPAVAFGYDAVGNLTRKTDYSTAAPTAYTYSAERPNAVSAVALATGGTRLYFYDASGNVRCSYISRSQASCTASHGSEYQARYNHNQQPVYQQRNQTYQTALAPSISHHTYGADQQPARQWGKEHSTNCATPGFNGCLEHHRIYLDRYEDTVGTFRHFNGGDRLYRTRAYVGDYAVFTRGRYGELEMSLLLRDRLGCVVGVESARLIGGRINTIVSESRHGFDAFGAPRANRERPGSSWQSRDPRQTPSRTQQGFTGHERLSGLQLIHMKGRVFDPILGRFHGVDPIIQFPLSSQGLNPYSYILNNPMAGVDPTGYQSVREQCNRRQSCEMRYSALATAAGDLKSDVAGMSTMGGTLGDTFRVLSSTANNGARGSFAAKFEKFEGAVEIGSLKEVGKGGGDENGSTRGYGKLPSHGADVVGSGGDGGSEGGDLSADAFLQSESAKSGQLFCLEKCQKSAESAHAAAAERYLGASIAAERESAWRVYAVGDGTFSFSYPSVSDVGRTQLALPERLPGLQFHSGGHTHWDSNHDFSPQDWRLITQGLRHGPGITLYLASGDGRLQCATPEIARRFETRRGASILPPITNFSGNPVPNVQLRTASP